MKKLVDGWYWVRLATNEYRMDRRSDWIPARFTIKEGWIFWPYDATRNSVFEIGPKIEEPPND